jgi:uncharacterized OB-fold protein
MIEGTPLPVTDNPVDAPFWEAALRGELVVQRCSDCGVRQFPPRPMCPACQSTARSWDVMAGTGRIWSFVVAHPPLLPTFAKIAPYAVVLVELDDDPTIRLVGNLVPGPAGEIHEVDPATVAIGRPVSVVFQTVTPDVALPRWVLT